MKTVKKFGEIVLRNKFLVLIDNSLAYRNQRFRSGAAADEQAGCDGQAARPPRLQLPPEEAAAEGKRDTTTRN